MSTKFVDLNIIDSLAFITIDKEASYNALNIAVLEQLRDCMKELNQSSEVRAMILTGAGEKAFIAGADIKEMSGMSESEGMSFSELGQQVTRLFENAPFPTVAAVNGFALGGGLEMALGCDFIYCTENSVFGLPEVSLGLIPGFGGTQRLARTVGRARAKEMIFTGRKLKAAEAKSIGLVLDIFINKEELISFCEKSMRGSMKNSILAIKKAKKILNIGIETDLEKGMSLESNAFAKMFTSFDMKEGTQAFIEKRQAQFKGE
ncbi:enoyl-CoA hydratase-related protein [Bacteriovoracaceae bacterium]|nr:enoyl-CoA hydratase-related protein [Bacteriovoracaceae bacterium]